eukprot:TRINITY_DN9373_c0_g1_i1.p1 TRINITY_DN9373_c0_g1~~TRINITY_DN9373_c0_g1_i1.p1  ORF type:complete len:293 (-),score=34.45 TRINITY_DN9373_c0_g1_i1:385-1263(-)
MDILLRIRDTKTRAEFEKYTVEHGSLSFTASSLILGGFLLITILQNLVRMVIIISTTKSPDLSLYYLRIFLNLGYFLVNALFFIAARTKKFHKSWKMAAARVLTLVAGLTSVISSIEGLVTSLEVGKTSCNVLISNAVIFMLSFLFLVTLLNHYLVSALTCILIVVFIHTRLLTASFGLLSYSIDITRNLSVALMVCSVYYVREKKLRELFIKHNKMHQEERAWRDVMNCLAEPILLLDKDKNVKYVNKAMRMLITKGENDMVTDNEVLNELINKASLTKKADHRESSQVTQ